MKRLLSSFALLIISSFVCLAQADESKHEFSVSYGYATLPQAVDLIGAGVATVSGGILTGFVDIITPADVEHLKRINNGGTGGFSFQYLYSLNRTIKLGGTVCYESTWGEWNNGTEYILHYPAIMATSKFMWFNLEHFAMYSKLSLGLMLVFDGKNEYFWVDQNCDQYGFVLRYSASKEDVTRIAYESWHYRYVGIGNALTMTNMGLSLEEYVNFIKDYSYNGTRYYITADNGDIYCTYYVKSNGQDGQKIPIPKTARSYQISGNNIDGFIIAALVGNEQQ